MRGWYKHDKNVGTIDSSEAGVRLYDGNDLKLFVLVDWGRSYFVCCLVHRGSTDDLSLLQISSGVFGSPGVSNCHATRCIC